MADITVDWQGGGEYHKHWSMTVTPELIDVQTVRVFPGSPTPVQYFLKYAWPTSLRELRTATNAYSFSFRGKVTIPDQPITRLYYFAVPIDMLVNALANVDPYSRFYGLHPHLYARVSIESDNTGEPHPETNPAWTTVTPVSVDANGLSYAPPGSFPPAYGSGASGSNRVLQTVNIPMENLSGGENDGIGTPLDWLNYHRGKTAYINGTFELVLFNGDGSVHSDDTGNSNGAITGDPTLVVGPGKFAAGPTGMGTGGFVYGGQFQGDGDSNLVSGYGAPQYYDYDHDTDLRYHKDGISDGPNYTNVDPSFTYQYLWGFNHDWYWNTQAGTIHVEIPDLPPPGDDDNGLGGISLIKGHDGYIVAFCTTDGLKIRRAWRGDLSLQDIVKLDLSDQTGEPRLQYDPNNDLITLLYRKKSTEIWRAISWDHGETWTFDPSGGGSAYRTNMSHAREVFNRVTNERLFFFMDSSKYIHVEVRDAFDHLVGTFPTSPNGIGAVQADGTSFEAVYVEEGTVYVDVVFYAGGARKRFRSFDDGRTWTEYSGV